MKISTRRIFGGLLVIVSILITIYFSPDIFGHAHILKTEQGAVGNAHVTWTFSDYSSSPVNYRYFVPINLMAVIGLFCLVWPHRKNQISK